MEDLRVESDQRERSKEEKDGRCKAAKSYWVRDRVLLKFETGECSKPPAGSGGGWSDISCAANRRSSS